MWEASQPTCVARRNENAQLLGILPKKLVNLETRLGPLRWAGYQFMSPLECTRQFAADYRSQFRETFYGPCDFEPELGTPEFETLWRMRLGADECLMSYPMYLKIAFHLFRRKDAEQFRRPHLFFLKRQGSLSWNKQQKKEYAETWSSQTLKIARMGHFQRHSYRGLPAQNDFKRRIRNAAKIEGFGRTAAMYVMQFPIVSPTELSADLQGSERADAIAEIKAQRGEETRWSPKVEPADLIQTCFAWPRMKSREETCRACPQEGACSQAE